MPLPIHHSRHGSRPYPAQPLPGGLGLSLARARVHELCGPARMTLAAMILEQSEGTVIWISPGWLPERPFPPGLRPFADPGRIIFANAQHSDDVLWSMEEALRSGAASLVLADLPAAPGLTPVRRLHLSAESGATAAHHSGRAAPLGLLLTPGSGGAQGVESRWHLGHSPSGSTLTEQQSRWQLTRLRARMEPPATWAIQRTATGKIGLDPVARTS